MWLLGNSVLGGFNMRKIALAGLSAIILTMAPAFADASPDQSPALSKQQLAPLTDQEMEMVQGEGWNLHFGWRFYLNSPGGYWVQTAKTWTPWGPKQQNIGHLPTDNQRWLADQSSGWNGYLITHTIPSLPAGWR